MQATATVNKSTTASLGREVLVVALALAAWTALVLWLADGSILITRPLWVDECFTVLVAGRSSPWAVISDLRHGVDGGAGLYHLVAWVLRVTTGALTPVVLRAASMVFTLAALCLVYAVLRRRFSRDASAAGVFAVGAHSMVVAMAFEGRFYALWLLCCALVAWFFGAAPGRRRDVALAVCAVLLTTSHWYGVVTLSIMMGIVFLTYLPRWSVGIRSVAPAAAGLLAFVAVWPLARGQREVLTVSSWVPDFTFGQLRGLADGFWFARIPQVGAAALALAIVLRWRRDRGVRALTGSGSPEPGAVALLSLATLPLALSAMSLVGQPSMLGRYALPAALAWAPWTAFAFALLGRWPSRVAAVAIAAFWLPAFVRETTAKREFAVGVAGEADALRQARAMHVPVVFTSTHTMYPLLVGGPGTRDAAALLDLPDSTLDKFMAPDSRFYQLNKGIRLERDFARVHAARFGFPALATQASLDTTASFVILESGARLPRGITDVPAYWRLLFPHHLATPAGEMLTRFQREAARSRPARSTSR